MMFFAVLLWFQLPFGQPGSISAVRLASQGHGILNVLPYYDAQTAYQHLQSYRPTGQRHVLAILALDVVLLIPAYAMFLGISLRRALLKAGARTAGQQAALYLPLIAGLCNLLEDILMAGLIGELPQMHPMAARLMGFTTLAKTLALSGTFLTLGGLMFFAWIQRFRRSRSGSATGQ